MQERTAPDVRCAQVYTCGVKRSVVGMLLPALLGIAACGDDASSRSQAETRRPVADTSMASLVGLWDDGRDGENTKLELRADGTAHIAFMAIVPAAWTLDAAARRVTVTSRRQADGSTVTQHFTYKPGDDVLTGRIFGPDGPERVFRRASPGAVAWWSRVRPQAESEESRWGGR